MAKKPKLDFEEKAIIVCIIFAVICAILTMVI